MVKFKTGYWGWLRSYSLGILAASGELVVPISESDEGNVGFFNVVDVNNNSTENIECWINGDSNRAITVFAGVSKQVNGSRFTKLTINNLTAVATSANEIKITIQKEFGRREEMEIKGMLV